MSGRCKFMKITKNEDGSETWTCYHQFQKRGLIQACFLKKGDCRYTSGPFKPDPEEETEENTSETAKPSTGP